MQPPPGLAKKKKKLLPSPEASLAALVPRHEAYLAEAARLRQKYSGQIAILIGFEGEWIRPAAYGPLVRSLAAHAAVDYFVGSLHHAAGVPIDLDGPTYARAVAAAGGSEERLFARYFDEQHGMLAALRPRVVGHFDLVRLFSAGSPRPGPGPGLPAWPAVWERAVRNLAVVRAYGGWLECNTSALRKGLPEPYPAADVAREWLRMGGRFTMSDDSHGIAQLATNYLRGLEYLEGLGVTEVWTLERKAPAAEGEKGEVVEKSVTLDEFRASLRLE